MGAVSRLMSVVDGISCHRSMLWWPCPLCPQRRSLIRAARVVQGGLLWSYGKRSSGAFACLRLCNSSSIEQAVQNILLSIQTTHIVLAVV